MKRAGDISIPHYENCADGVGVRDVDFTCEGGTPPYPFADEPRVPIDDNLRERFRTAATLDVPEPGRTVKSTVLTPLSL